MNDILIINEESCGLYNADFLIFPSYYVNKHHLLDYKPSDSPVKEVIWHNKPDHNRLLLRISIKLRNKTYIPITFVCDTGAPSFLYLNAISYVLFEERIMKDNDSGIDYLLIDGRKFPVKPTSAPHEDCNIIGVRALGRFQLYLNDDGVFDFDNLPDFF
jgi:hypothetical protein